ncbi:MAG TPA: putative toxin-antitoxin system toxin component, PIN family [Candidatus Sulfotelmatobacter sp.]|jgi:putative PIN family toxin of toxin-antitoxin system
MRAVIDTNVLISAVIFPNSVPRQAVGKTLHDGVLLFSGPTIDELRRVIFRSKLDRYVSRKQRLLFLAQLDAAAEFVSVIQVVRECRDLKDDKFLEVAVNGRADVVVTGDADLLAMNPWRGISVLNAVSFLTI